MAADRNLPRYSTTEMIELQYYSIGQDMHLKRLFVLDISIFNFNDILLTLCPIIGTYMAQY